MISDRATATIILVLATPLLVAITSAVLTFICAVKGSGL